MNSFSLKSKIFDVKDREMINMFWKECNEPSFDKHICQPDNFFYLNGKNVIYLRVTEIVMNYMEADKSNFGKLKRKLIENQKIFQYVYASVYHEVYSFVEKRGADMRNNLHLNLKGGKIEKNIHKNQFMDTFQSLRIGHHPRVRFRKKFSRMRTLRKRKKLLRNKSKKKWTIKNKKKKA